MSVIGFSTGAIAYGDFSRALRLLNSTSVEAVELSALRAAELPLLLAELPKMIGDIRKRYAYVSLHAPTDFENEETVVRDLSVACEIGINVVVHPDTISETSLWSRLGGRLCLENMDSRKATGRTVEELMCFYEKLPDAKLCFDIAHARQFDATMTEAARIIEAFRDRLVQVHISEVNSRGKHFAMSFAAKRAYEPFSEVLRSVPVIIESIVTPERIVEEINVTEQLTQFRSKRCLGGRTSHLSHAHAMDAAE